MPLTMPPQRHGHAIDFGWKGFCRDGNPQTGELRSEGLDTEVVGGSPSPTAAPAVTGLVMHFDSLTSIKPVAPASTARDRQRTPAPMPTVTKARTQYPDVLELQVQRGGRLHRPHSMAGMPAFSG